MGQILFWSKWRFLWITIFFPSCQYHANISRKSNLTPGGICSNNKSLTSLIMHLWPDLIFYSSMVSRDIFPSKGQPRLRKPFAKLSRLQAVKSQKEFSFPSFLQNFTKSTEKMYWKRNCINRQFIFVNFVKMGENLNIMYFESKPHL